MNLAKRLSLALAVAAAMVGCDKAKETAPLVTTTTVRSGPATMPSTSQPIIPATQPAESFLTINGRTVRFPATHIEVVQAEPTVGLMIYSADPKGALAANYAGNRYYLNFNLEIKDLSELSSTEYAEQAPTTERRDSPYGIFLEGDKWQLQPRDVRVSFSRQGSQVVVQILPGSKFLQFDTHDEFTQPRTVLVSGVLHAQLLDPRKTK